ncbi:MAG: hypothetical protein DI551_06555 [Micavibrio aeruginosavorus]|uniref:Lipoprotein n=1 Tax=Micavibrio aeruginosavorus TaxID=349221 RepID=A0A2W5MX42_9BACT|nr:MAG: hypothetical protein DI551_06555 [Micavibrio aeruginosavorus]
MKHSIALLALLMLSACADTLYPSMAQYNQAKKLGETTVENFPHCQNYDCKLVKRVALNDYDWTKIEQAFGSPAKDAAQEREKIAKTIGAFEQIVGPLTKTQDDRAGSFLKTGEGQLDCVDESTNTTVYLVALVKKGMIRFHNINQPKVRYPLISGRGWMHQTAVVTDKESGGQYAVDSWFRDNGEPADIVPLTAWMDGWHPQ